MYEKKFIFCFCASVLSVIVIAVVCLFFRYDQAKIGNVLVITDRFTGIQKLVGPSGHVFVRGEKGEVEGPSLKPINVQKENLRVSCSIKWRDGKIYYTVTVLTTEKKYNKVTENPFNLSNITIILEDNENYTVAELPISIKNFLKTDFPDIEFLTPDEAFKMIYAKNINNTESNKAYLDKTILDAGENPIWLTYSSSLNMQKNEFKVIERWAVSWKM